MQVKSFGHVKPSIYFCIFISSLTADEHEPVNEVELDASEADDSEAMAKLMGFSSFGCEYEDFYFDGLVQ